MIEYTEKWLVLLVFKLQGSVALRASTFALPTAMIAVLLTQLEDNFPGFLDDIGVEILKNSQLWTASTFVLGILLIFRTNRAMARFWEGTGLLHQMRGEWFDSVSCCVTFTRGALATKNKDVMEFRHTIVRLMSLCHASALEEIAGGGEELETIDTYGLNSQTLMHLKDCKEKHDFNLVEVVLHLIQTLITQGLEDGVLKIPPPILSRVYQTLSRGFVNLLNAKKIADTRFPFPYAQLISMMLLLNVFMTPCLIVCLTTSPFWAPIFSFVPIFGFASLNFIGVELENPFGDDANDLPLEHFQTEMNKCLLMLLQDNADLIAGTSSLRCRYVFSELRDSMDKLREIRNKRPSAQGLKLATESLKLTVNMPETSALLHQYLPNLKNEKPSRFTLAEAYAKAEKASQEALQGRGTPDGSMVATDVRVAEAELVKATSSDAPGKAAAVEQSRDRLEPTGVLPNGHKGGQALATADTGGSATPPREPSTQDSEIEERIDAAIETAMDVIEVVEESPNQSRLEMANVGALSYRSAAGQRASNV
mmetsp:Transcript_58785/g.108529  ORF Transcript_58785/g.108529 Transcript_58785/m.108529 type:complete len:537 (-) Transcript_58785:125-1735(-)